MTYSSSDIAGARLVCSLPIRMADALDSQRRFLCIQGVLETPEPPDESVLAVVIPDHHALPRLRLPPGASPALRRCQHPMLRLFVLFAELLPPEYLRSEDMAVYQDWMGPVYGPNPVDVRHGVDALLRRAYPTCGSP